MAVTLYLVMRNDIPSLNPGKLAAQAAHVANVAVKKGKPSVVKEWERQTTQGFGTTIVLGAAYEFLDAKMSPMMVFDPTYPCEIPFEVGEHLAAFDSTKDRIHLSHGRAFYIREEFVGAWVFGVDERPSILDGLELYP